MLIPIVICISSLVIGFNLGNRYSAPQPSQTNKDIVKQPNLLTVKTLKISPVSSYSVARSYTGEISTVRESDLGFERGGKVVSLYVKEGDRVIKGTPMAQLDISQLKTQKLNQEAQKSQALAVLTELTTGARRETIEAAQ
ncbi:MAG: biotin/lipoyl-binding protein, partial [Crocosphaera sp.]